MEKSGVLNLGIAGMMLIGAAVGVWCHFAGWPMILAVTMAVAAGALSSLIFGVLALTFMTNQYAAGLALAIFGTGVLAFIGRGFGSRPVHAIGQLHLPILSDLPLIGPLPFQYDPLVYLALGMYFVISWFLYQSKAGLALRAIGESSDAAHAIGFPVIRIRYLAVMFGGAMAVMGGRIP